MSDEFEVVSEEASRRRHDASGAKQKSARKVRSDKGVRRRKDSVVAAPSDGFGSPFSIDVQKGWRAFWVSRGDEARFSWRPWQVGCWGDPRIARYMGAAAGAKGEPISSRGLKLYLMLESDAIALDKADERRKGHEARMAAERQRAEKSEAYGRKGYMRTTVQEITV